MHIFVSIWRDGNSILAINVSKWLWLKNGSLWDKGLFSEVVFRIIWELGIDTSRSLLMYCKKRVILKIHWFVRSRKSLWELGGSIIKTTKWEILWLSHPLLFNSYPISSSSINRLQTSVKHFCYHTMHQISLYGTPLGIPESETLYRCTNSKAPLPSQKRRDRNKLISNIRHPNS